MSIKTYKLKSCVINSLSLSFLILSLSHYLSIYLSISHHWLLLLAKVEDAVHNGVDTRVETREDEQAFLDLLVQQRGGRPVKAEPEEVEDSHGKDANNNIRSYTGKKKIL